MSYNFDTSHDSDNFTPANQSLNTFGYGREVEGITIHWWGDPNQNPVFENVRDYLCRVGGNTSAHYVATGTNRQVACIVAPGDVAWHSGSAWGNARTIGIEVDPRGRAEDFDVVAELIADIRSAYGDVPLYWHSYFTSTSCPGIYKNLIDNLDQLSYTKYSAPVEWGQGGDINPKQPVPVPTPTEPTPPPQKEYYKLIINNKQVAAYSTDVNAYKGYVEYGKTGVTVKYKNADVTADLISKFTAPSPTTQDPTGTPLPDTGKPVIDKDDFAEFIKTLNENNDLLKQIKEIVSTILTKLTSIFKG